MKEAIATSSQARSGPPRVLKWIDDHFEETLLILLLTLMACVELLQVVARNVPFMPALTWAEEFCRFTWIATVFLSLPYTIRTATTLRVTALLEVLPWKVQNVLNVIIDVITCIILAVLSWFAVEVMMRIVASGETSPAMLLPMWVMYAIILVGFVLGVVRSIQMAIIHVKTINVPPVSSLDAQVEEELAATDYEVKAAEALVEEEPGKRNAIDAALRTQYSNPVPSRAETQTEPADKPMDDPAGKPQDKADGSDDEASSTEDAAHKEGGRS